MGTSDGSLVLENRLVRLSLSDAEGSWALEDRRVGVTWSSPPGGQSWVTLQRATSLGVGWVPLTLQSLEANGGALWCRFADTDGLLAPFSLAFRLIEDGVQVYLVPDGEGACPTIRLFTLGLEASAQEAGEALLPIRMGLLLPAAGIEPVELSLGTYDYEGLHMAMAGLFKSGAALLATWGDPYVTLGATRTMMDGDSCVRLSFTLSKTAQSLQLRCLGRGDLTTLAEAYRERAEALGYRVPWSEKRLGQPQVDRLFGACNLKLWTALERRVDESVVERSVEVHWTFEEAAQIAEHLRHDLDLEGVLFHLGGWTRYGYDCRHPDIMPANPECGGDEGLADCARRVQACGYLFCLHDNYQDMYRDAPSWDEACLQREPDGSAHVGGVWLGGQAYHTCSREGVRLARRPENLPRVRDVAHPDLYFTDTTFAADPQECFDPRHPLIRQEDMRWKVALADYARDVFGMFGSEGGREWAVPHADFFEGLASVYGKHFHLFDPDDLGARAVPFVDMVFRDCIAIYGKYAYAPEQMAEQVIHHVAMGRPLYYHALGDHLYWEHSATEGELPLSTGPGDPAAFTRAHNGWAEGYCLWDRFIKNTHQVLGPLHALTAESLIEAYAFLDEERRVRRTTFGNGVTVIVNGSMDAHVTQDRLAREVCLPPYGFLVEADTFVAFHALSWNGRAYDEPVLFALSSSGRDSLGDAGRVRVFHGFGDSRLTWRGGTVDVRREAILVS